VRPCRFFRADPSESRGEAAAQSKRNGRLCAPAAPPVSENGGFQRTGTDDGICSRLTG
jgi:hypothetical protein